MPATTPLLGLAGFGGAGKNAGAAVLVEVHGFAQRAYADKLREYLLEANPHLPDGRRWADVFHEIGYEQAKRSVVGFREVMVDLGDAARRVIGPNVWVDAAVRCLDRTVPTVFTDVRYHNEIDAIRDRGGTLVWIDRPGVGPALDAAGHPLVSEVTIGPEDCDHRAVNNSTPERLAAELHLFVRLNAPFDAEPATLAG